MKLALFSKPQSGERVLEAATINLDSLWQEAEKMGRVELGREWSSDKVYTAKIHFSRRSGSSITAKGQHTDPRLALGMAIDEARDLGAR